MFIDRAISPILLAAKKSLLLLGPRQTGKSTLIKSFAPELTINLSDQEVFLEHLKDPGLIKSLVQKKKSVFIDEIQRVPSLLNTIQFILDDTKNPPKFYLSGSSARKLKRGQANLLPGRVLIFNLSPLSFKELGENFNFERALSLGALPGAWDEESSDSEWKKILKSYGATYLREEVQAEALTRDLEGFSRFFDVMLSRSGDFIDFSKFASEAMIDRSTARRYYDIFVDTLLVYNIPSFVKSSRKRLVQHPRYYFFDVGVWNASLGNFSTSKDRVGKLFEHFFLQQIISAAHMADKELKIYTYRTEHGSEVDFILELEQKIISVELKASKRIAGHDLRGLKGFAQFYKKEHESFVAYLGDESRNYDSIKVMRWDKVISEIFQI